MLPLRLFLRNHSVLCAYSELPSAVRALFPPTSETLAWAEFYMADHGHRKRQFEFHVASNGRSVRYRADTVMLQDAFGVVTLVTLPDQPNARPKCLCLPSKDIERAVLTARR